MRQNNVAVRVSKLHYELHYYLLLYLVSKRQSAVDVQAVITLQFQQRIAQKFLLRQEAERERKGAEGGGRLGRSSTNQLLYSKKR